MMPALEATCLRTLRMLGLVRKLGDQKEAATTRTRKMPSVPKRCMKAPKSKRLPLSGWASVIAAIA